METQTYFVTKEGFEALTAEKDRLVVTGKPRALERVKHARDMGSLEDNDEYDAAREALNFIEGRINEIEDVLERAEIITQADIAQKAEITLGSTVTVEVSGKAQKITLVGSIEADVSQGKVSHESPVGEKLLGHKEGDIVKIELPQTTLEYKILKIHS